MSDMIDNSKGYDAIAYAKSGGVPWHDKGFALLGGESKAVQLEKAGLNFKVRAAQVKFIDAARPEVTELQSFVGRNVLYRDDTMHPLGILAKGYHIFQPEEVYDFHSKIIEAAGAQIEVLGALDGGRRVWVLSKLNKGSDILDGDIIEPYLLSATSYDGSMSNVFKLTAIRVVCHNTITAAVGYKGEGQSEGERSDAIIRIPHSQKVDIDAVRVQMGITLNAWERFVFVSRRLALQKVTNEYVGHFLKKLLGEGTPDNPVEGTRAYQTIEALYEGAGKGSGFTSSNGTAFGLLNAVTDFADHIRGSDSKRLGSAWFGTGDGLKARALFLLEKDCL